MKKVSQKNKQKIKQELAKKNEANVQIDDIKNENSIKEIIGKNYEKCIIICALLTFIIVTFVLAIRKNAYFVDEIYSYGLANSSYMPFIPVINEWVGNDYFRDYIGCVNDGFSMKSVWINQSYDTHPPFFYLCINFITSIFRSVGFTKWIGLSVNIITLTITVILLYYIVRSFIESKVMAVAIVAVYAFSSAYYSNMLFIRMYAMATMFSVLLLFLLLRWRQDNWELKPTKHKNNWYCLGAVCLTVFLGSLTHYFVIIYSGILCGVCALDILIQKKYKSLIAYCGSLVVTILVYFKVWPYMLGHVAGRSSGSGVIGGLFSVEEISHIKGVIKVISNSCFAHKPLLVYACIIIALAGIVVLIVKKKFNLNWSYVMLVVPTIGVTLLIDDQVNAAPRYYYSFFPLAVVAILVCAYTGINTVLDTKYIQFLSVLLLVLIVMNNHNPSIEFYRYTDSYPELIESLAGKNAIYVNSGWAKYTANVLEFINYDNIFLTADENLEWMRDDEIVNESDSMVLYIDKEIDNDKMLEEALAYSHFTDYELLHDKFYSNAYLLK